MTLVSGISRFVSACLNMHSLGTDSTFWILQRRTGHIAIAASQIVGSEGRVIGIDISAV